MPGNRQPGNGQVFLPALGGPLASPKSTIFRIHVARNAGSPISGCPALACCHTHRCAPGTPTGRTATVSGAVPRRGPNTQTRGNTPAGPGSCTKIGAGWKLLSRLRVCGSRRGQMTHDLSPTGPAGAWSAVLARTVFYNFARLAGWMRRTASPSPSTLN